MQSFEKLGTTLGGESTSCRCYFRLRHKALRRSGSSSNERNEKGSNGYKTNPYLALKPPLIVDPLLSRPIMPPSVVSRTRPDNTEMLPVPRLSSSNELKSYRKEEGNDDAANRRKIRSSCRAVRFGSRACRERARSDSMDSAAHAAFGSHYKRSPKTNSPSRRGKLNTLGNL